MKLKRRVLVAVSILFMTAGTLGTAGALGGKKPEPPPEARTQAVLDPKAAKIRIITEDGGHLAWHPKGGKILFDRIGNDGWFDLWEMNPDGTGERCLTANHPVLPNRHIGQPAWHPSGRWIVLQAQKGNVPRRYDTQCTPGAGTLNDLWLLTPDGAKGKPLHTVSREISKDAGGVLHPHFSHDGTRLFWAERVGDSRGAFGAWILRIGRFVVDEKEGPMLTDIRDYNPGGKRVFFESHNFSPDDKYVLFTGAQDGSLDIYEMEVATGKVRQLTDDSRKVWNEHAHYSPDGKKIVWMSSKGLRFEGKPFFLQTEFWMMNRDGSGKRQLTWLNTPGHPHHLGKKFAVAADSDWSPDGKRLIGLALTHMPDTPKRGSGTILMIDLPGEADVEVE